MTNPLPAEHNGKDAAGKFAKGNAFGRGNPNNQKVQILRNALLEAVGTEDLAEIVRALIAKAKEGDVAAARELFDRVLGKATQAVELSSPDGTMGQPNVLNLAVLSVKDLETVRQILAKAEGGQGDAG